MDYLALYNKDRELFFEMKKLSSTQYANQLIGMDIRKVWSYLERAEKTAWNVFDNETIIACFIGEKDDSKYLDYKAKGYTIKKIRKNYTTIKKYKELEKRWDEAVKFHVEGINIFREYDTVEEIYIPFHKYVAEKLGAIGYRNIRYCETNWYTSYGLGGPGFELLMPNGNKIYLGASHEGSYVYVSQIGAFITNKGLGTKAIEALKAYADEYCSGVIIYKVCNHKYFQKIPWLHKRNDMSYQYDVA